MKIKFINASSSKPHGTLKFPSNMTIGDVRQEIYEQLGAPVPNRQILRLKKNGRPLKDTDTIESLQLADGEEIYLKDLGPQIAWKTVFLVEYSGPLFIYLCFYVYRLQMEFAKGNNPQSIALSVHIAALCNTLHYVKRLLETVFVHRFSHPTMPLWNLFKNSAYYWGFTALIAWHINQPLYSPAEMGRLWTAFALFILCEYGNFTVHMTFRSLRSPGSNERKIPMPNRNFFTRLFDFVSCPNYTYEIGAWVAFAVMTSCVPAFLFAAVGAYQMAVWAKTKHRNYMKEFQNYPKHRRAIFPFML